MHEKVKPIVTDTSPLLLLLIGFYNTDAIENFRRFSKKYDSEDYDLLFQYVAKRKVIVTPHVLSEISSFAKMELKNRFSEFIEENRPILGEIDEEHVSKAHILASPELVKFGFTDTSIILAAKENDALVLTDDFPLWGICKKAGLETKHMTEILSKKEIFRE